MSLYLKYRPQDFESLVGQKFVKDTLSEALETGKTTGAYLLCGPRGTGKTTTARILAKGFNCKNLKNGNPCLSCDICNDFTEERLIDVIEIDAASHTGVDNIREIIERAQFKPTKAKYKIYIIDEVHMLSKGAFNALLKILEEPPKHVKFILATTETHKVPETILSRCQRYDFKSITKDDIKSRLSFIAKEEKVKIDEESLDYIAIAANGALRNAISLFEQLIKNSEIKFTHIKEVLGLTDSDKIKLFYKYLLNKDSQIIEELEKLGADGKNLKIFFKDLLFYVKEDIINNFSDKNTPEKIFILDILNETLSKLKISYDEQTTIFVGLMKILGVYNNIPQEKGKTQIKKGNISSTKILNKKIEVKAETKLETKKEETIDHSDAFDIFGGEKNINNISEEKLGGKNQENKKNTTKKLSSNNNFDLQSYLASLKKLGAKGALIISLKQASSVLIKGEDFKIVMPNKFTLKAINTSDNRALLSKGLEEVGIIGLSINIS